ncbi:hypothetical protein VaNZ11_008077 [Volvox africanus]|uniref:Rab3-GAP regulatory subunit N-terminal domain-containing protein n=1 Tax=Volvox africanus TaxID=51714 RepID=A0ABQ5S5V3_9CHLO|nr:hypothetical protein VaNZ11_008077 [Volvox africanus]
MGPLSSVFTRTDLASLLPGDRFCASAPCFRRRPLKPMFSGKMHPKRTLPGMSKMIKWSKHFETGERPMVPPGPVMKPGQAKRLRALPAQLPAVRQQFLKMTLPRWPGWPSPGRHRRRQALNPMVLQGEVASASAAETALAVPSAAVREAHKVMMEDQELLQQEQQQRLIAAAATPAQPPSKYSLVVLLSGTREGALQLHHADTGAVLLRQQLHSGPVVSIAVRTWRMGLNPSDAVEDVTVGWADAVVRLAAWELRAAATTCYAAYAAAAAVRARGVAGAPGGGQSRFTLWGSSPAAAPTGPEVRPLAVQKWEMPSGAARGRSCVVCCGQRPRDLYSLLQGIGSSSIATGKTIFLAAGKPPSCLAALEVDEQSSGGGGALSYISSVATSVWGLARTARSVAAAPLFLRDGLKSFVLNPLQLAGIGGGSGGVAPSAPAPLASFPDAAAGQRPPVTGVWRQHRDDGRAVLSLAPAPYGSLVAAVDNLGRVFLVELGTMLVSRMWKGYRDAQIAWIEVHERNVARLLGRQRSEDRCDRKPAQQQEQVTEQQQQQQSLQQGRKQLQQKPQHTSQLQEEPPQASASGPSLRGCDGGHNDNACQQVAIGPGAGCRDADRSGYKGSHVQDLDRMAPNKGERDRRPNYRETVNPGSHAAQSSSMFSLPQEMAGQPKAAPGQGDAQKHVCEAAGGHGGRSNAGEYMLLLAVYAPRRQTLELWFPLQGERLAAIASPPKARLLQRGGGGAGGASGELGTWRVADAASAASPPMTPTGCMMCFVGTAPNLGSGFELEQAASVGRDGLQLLDVETVFGLT